MICVDCKRDIVSERIVMSFWGQGQYRNKYQGVCTVCYDNRNTLSKPKRDYKLIMENLKRKKELGGEGK